MIALLQRVDHASVRTAAGVSGAIETGLVVLLGCLRDDGEGEALRLAEKVARYRVFADADGRTNLDVRAVGGAVLVVPQFTLAAQTNKGNRPGFDRALAPEQAKKLVSVFADALRRLQVPVQEGVFGAEMWLDLRNHGPASYILEVGYEH